jgi:Spy/CpxP family protein refolding chaperone
MTSFWDFLQERLAIDVLLGDVEHVHNHLQRQEITMAKQSDELADIAQRVNALRDAQSTSATNVRDALARLEQKVTDLSDGELSDENQAKVDDIKAELDNVKTAAESIDDGYEAPVVEPSPFPEGDDGSVENTQRGAL